MPIDLTDLGPLYHSYEFFGATNEQIAGIFRPNQLAKAPILRAYIQYAIAKSRRAATDRVTFLELFCADGYYTMAARRLGADHATGVDNDRDGHLRLAPAIAARLGLDHVSFEQRDVHDLRDGETYTVVANLGGLYHVSDPLDVLRASWKATERYLIVQSVVSIADRKPRLFRSAGARMDLGLQVQRGVAAARRRRAGRPPRGHAFQRAGRERPSRRSWQRVPAARTNGLICWTSGQWSTRPPGGPARRAASAPPTAARR